MTQVVIGLGSNIQPQQNLISAVNRLRELFSDLKLSPIYQTAPLGFSGQDFWNLVAIFNFSAELSTLIQLLRNIEFEHGRSRPAVKFSSRCLDIDILLFGDAVGEHAGLLLPRPDILHYAFVLRPLSDILPAAKHPVCQKTYAELWAEFAKNTQQITPLSAHQQAGFEGFFAKRLA